MVRWMKLAASGIESGGSNPEGSQFRVPRMSGMKAPAIMQAMPSSRLLMLTVISFPPGLRLMRLRQFCPRGSWPGFGAGGFGAGNGTGGHWFFPPG